jgi:MFS transporter, ACS family, hexuronate transporter
VRSRNTMIGLLFTGGVISYLDRAALSVAAPMIVAELGLDAASLGIVFSAFFVGYSIACFLGGLAADKYGPTRVILWTMLLWSLFCGLTATATTITAMLIIRILFGMAEGPYQSNTVKLIGNWFPTSKRATAISLAISGTTLGGALAGPIVGFLAVAYGWKIAFIAIAAVGMVWSAAWALIGRDMPPAGTAIEDDGPGQVQTMDIAGSDTAHPVSTWSYLANPAVLSTAVAFFGFAYLLYFFLSWFPSYLTMERHLSVRDMSLVTVIPWGMGFVGYLLGGVVSDFLCKVTGQPILARKLVLVSCLLASAVCVALTGYANSATSAAALMGASVLFLYLSANSYFALILEMVALPRVGGVSGFIHMIANFAGVLAPVITGYTVQASGSFTSAFVLAGGIALLGAISVAVFVPRKPAEKRVAELQGA